MIAAYKKNPNILEFSSLKFPDAHCTSLTAMFSRVAHYEGGPVCSHARSLWRLEPLRIAYV